MKKIVILTIIATILACGGWELASDDQDAQATSGPTEVCVDNIAYLIWPQGVVAKLRSDGKPRGCF